MPIVSGYFVSVVASLGLLLGELGDDLNPAVTGAPTEAVGYVLLGRPE